MDLDYAFLADKATLTHDKKLVVVGGDIDSATVRELPALVQATLVARLVFGLDESPSGHTFGLECMTPTGEKTVVANGVTIHATPVSSELDQPVSARLLIELTIVFSQAGPHNIRLLLNDRLAKTFPFRVKHVAHNEEQ